jgi:photosystem II stability/assembly factor-like uncharacterized protein
MIRSVYTGVARAVRGRAATGVKVARRTTLAAFAGGAVVAFAPSVAAGAVPYASWYWTMVVPGSNANTLLLATSNGVYRSSDGGRVWAASGLSGVDVTSVVRTGNTVLAAGVRVPPSSKNPVLVLHRDYYVPAGTSVVETSTDGGMTWQTVAPTGLPTAGVSALAVDPTNSAVVYAVVRTGALYRSSDGGHSFQRVAGQVGGTPWAVGITHAGALLSGNMTTGNYLSSNQTQWQHTSFTDPKGGAMVMEYAPQPNDPSRILMTSYGVLLSTDGGKTWHPVLKTKVMFGPVAWAANNTVAYAVGFDQSIWRTDNGGQTWTKVA